MHFDKEKIIRLLQRVQEICLCVLLFCVPFSKALAEISITVALVAWIFYIVLAKKIVRVTKVRFFLPAIVFLSANAISVILSVNFELSCVAFFGKTLEYCLVLFIAYDVAQERASAYRLMIALLLSGILVAFDAGYQFVFGVDLLRGYEIPSRNLLTACFKNQNTLSGWLVIVIPVIFSLAFIPKNRIIRLVAIVLSTTLVACLALTDSRAAWAAFAIMIGVVLLFLVCRKKFLYAIAIMLFLIMAVLLCIWFLPYNLKEHIFSIGQIATGSDRLTLWTRTLHMIQDFPVFGSGVNTFNYIVPFYGKTTEYSHNSFLQITAETGIVGISAFLWFMYTIIKRGLVKFIQTKEPLIGGLLAGLLAFLIHSSFDNNLFALQLAVMFWFMTGFLAAISE